MQKERKSKVALKLRWHKDRHGKVKWFVRYGRRTKDDSIGWVANDWQIESDSYQPRPVFFIVVNRVFKLVSKIPTIDKCFEKMGPKIRVALSEAAPLCGCKFKKNDFGGFTWFLKDTPYMDFVVLDFERHKDRSYKGKGLLVLAEKVRDRCPDFKQMERKSRAMFRAAIVVLKNGVWKFVPGKTLPEEKRHRGR